MENHPPLLGALGKPDAAGSAAAGSGSEGEEEGAGAQEATDARSGEAGASS